MKIKLTHYDKLWSKMVRERDQFCVVCGGSGGLNAHHILTRSIKSIRFCLENGITLCAGHHVFNHEFSAHKTPEAFKRWYAEKFPVRWDYINKLKLTHKSERDAVEEFKLLITKE